MTMIANIVIITLIIGYCIFSFIKDIRTIKKGNMSDAPDAAAIVEAAADAVRQLENLNIQRKSKR